MNNLYKLFSVTILLCLGIHVTAQNESSALSNYLKLCDFLLQDGGKWKAVNKDFKPGDSASVSYFGLEYIKGINPNTLHVKISGYYPKRSAWLTSWDGAYTWDYNKHKVVYQISNIDGAVAVGESGAISESQMELLFTVRLPNAKIDSRRELMVISGQNILATGFIQRPGSWEKQNAITYQRLEQPPGGLTFMSTRDGNFEIYAMDATGENLKNLSCNKATDYAFSYLPDKRLAFYTNRDGNDEIYILDADGKKQTNITNHPASDRIPNASRDGKYILFVSDRDHQQGEIYAAGIDGKNPVRLTNNEFFEDAPTWSPDGKRILFTRELRDLNDTSANAVGNGEIFIMDADGKNETRLTDRPGYDGGTSFSPGGDKIAFYGKTAEGHYEIFIMDSDGKNIINITGDAMEDYSPSWSPDGKWIACTRGDSKNYDIWVIHLETGIKTQLTMQPKRDESPIWQPGN